MTTTPNEALVALSQWIDNGNAHRDAEAVTWGRLAKITEEAGEAIQAFIGATGQNPRKGTTHSTADVVEELLDVAVTALGAVEHITGHDGTALRALDAKILRVAARAGVVHPCGHFTAIKGCGGCDPGAVEFVRDDYGQWRKATKESA